MKPVRLNNHFNFELGTHSIIEIVIYQQVEDQWEEMEHKGSGFRGDARREELIF